MRLRRFNEAGLALMDAFLDSLTTDTPDEWPEDLLTDATATELVEPEAIVEQNEWATRFDAAEYLNAQLADAGFEKIELDIGIWTWLSMFYFEQLCPADNHGNRKPGERARWIPATGNFRKYYRHLLAGPFRIYRAHRDNPERARVLLCTPPHSPGDIAEQLASRQEIVTNAGIIGAATRLYVSDETGKPKRGAAGRSGGSARRLADVLNQFDMTWDLYSMSSDAVVGMLPGEFDKFQ
jgi:hypothetical protein